jgi:putative endopeptidase
MSVAAGTGSGLDLAWQLPRTRPQDDLFRHVNGRWLDTVSIPQDRATCGTVLDLKDATGLQLREILERAAASGAPAGSDEQRTGDLYASFLDEELADRVGVAPLREDLDDIASIDSPSRLARILGRLQRKGISGAFKISVSADAGRSDRCVLYVSQGGLGLPDESYYRATELTASYLTHLRTMLRLAGLPDAERAAGRVLALETRIASWHADRVSARDVVRGYTLVQRGGLEKLAPCFDWAAWCDGLEAIAPVLDAVVVRQTGFLNALSAELADWREPASWRDWLSWRLIRAMSPLLSSAFTAESFAFYQTELTGVPRQPERWQRGLRVVESALGEALARRYVAEHFPPRSRVLVADLIGNLVEAYRRGIEALDWMSPPTKARALEKLAAFGSMVGNPDRWRDETPVLIRREDLVGNVQRAQSAKLSGQLARLGAPVDRAEWAITPQTVNAYYDPARNQVVVPAAILRPPFFSPDADPAVNYGAIGAVIGHEIGHAFDDRGAKYDGAGNLADWWTQADRAAFEDRANALIAQYDALTPAQLPGQHVNGALTVSENIGDLGGLVMAYRAYLLSLNGAAPPIIDGLTGAQRLFLSWARIWRGKVRDAEYLRRLAVDPHAPREIRCNAVVRNMDEFHEAFGVRPGDGLWLKPTARVRIW